MGKGRPQKYNRITCQEKFMLRRLVLLEKMSVKHAARSLGINYSTAKTIMFFYRKLSLNSSSSQEVPRPTVTASFFSASPSISQVEIVSSIGGSNWAKGTPQREISSEELKQVKLEVLF